MNLSRKEYNKEYYNRNKAKLRAGRKLYYQKNKENCLNYFKVYYKDNRERYLIDSREKSFESKNKVISLMGGKCASCGFSDYRALQIDHVNGGGVKEQKERKTGRLTYHKEVVDSFLKKEGKYQILCANCNWIKRFVRGEVRKG